MKCAWRYCGVTKPDYFFVTEDTTGGVLSPWTEQKASVSPSEENVNV